MEDVGAPGSAAHFSLEPILLELEGGQYVGPLLPVLLKELVCGIRGDGYNIGRGKDTEEDKIEAGETEMDAVTAAEEAVATAEVDM